MTINIMSVDLEDYFCDLPIQEWSKFQSRIENTTDVILEIFNQYDVKSTFFTVGYFADKFPKLIKKIFDAGHELGTHTYSHMDIRKSNPQEFEKDLTRSINAIEKITGEKVLGFRAPLFSVNQNNSWVFDILKKYLKYDSSVLPTKTPLYGINGAPREIYHPSSTDFTKNDHNESFIEIPPTTYRIAKYNLPTCGGFYIRSLPYFLIQKGIDQSNKNKNPAMIYIHPKDLDKNMPKISEYSWHYYYGKHNIKKKFEKLLQKNRFSSAKEVLSLS